MANQYASIPRVSSQPAFAAPESNPKTELTEILRAARELAFAQTTFDQTLWRCASCAATHADRSSLTHSPTCQAGRVLEAFSALRRKVVGHA